jgi:hypothetical protein
VMENVSCDVCDSDHAKCITASTKVAATTVETLQVFGCCCRLGDNVVIMLTTQER